MFKNWSTKRKIGTGVLVFFVIIILAGALLPSEEEERTPEPAKFEISNLSLSSSEINSGGTITALVSVKNTGGKEGSKEVKLTIDGNTKTESVALAPKEQTTVSFEISREDTGTYDVSVSGMSASFDVVKPTTGAKLDIGPAEIDTEPIKAGGCIPVSVDLANLGDRKGETTLEIKVNEEVKLSRDVTLEAGEVRTENFCVTIEENGVYEITVPTSYENYTRKVLVEERVTVGYEVTTKLGSAYLRATVSGPERGYSLHLSGPDKQTVGEGAIFEDDMADGTEAVDVSMTGLLAERKNPKPGQYTLVVKQSYPEKTVFEATPEFEGPEISINDAQFETSYDFSGNIDETTLTVKNDGGLPVFADEMKVIVNGEESEVPLMDKALPHEQTTQIETSTFITGLEKGVHPVTIELYSQGNRLAGYDTQVKIGTTEKSKENVVTVLGVVDGDTVDVSFSDGGENTVRLVGVDTPESYGDVNPEEWEGISSEEHLKNGVKRLRITLLLNCFTEKSS